MPDPKLNIRGESALFVLSADPESAALLANLCERRAHSTVPGSSGVVVQNLPIGDISEKFLGLFGGGALYPPADEELGASPVDIEELACLARKVITSADNEASTPLLSDLRLALSFEFWAELFSKPCDVVLVLRHAKDAVQASERVHGVNGPVARALSERYLLRALAALDGRRVFIVDLDEVLADPTGFGAELDRFIGHATFAGPSQDEAVLRVAKSSDAEDLFASLQSLSGIHERFSSPTALEEDPRTSEILRLRAALAQTIGGLTWAACQIEPVVRAEPKEADPPAEHDARDGEEDPTEPSEDGPYPPNASEDRHGYHRWLSAHRQPVVLGGPTDPPVRTPATRTPRWRQKEPLISVLVPVWRPPLWALERSVGSVLAQDFADWELLLCDDASGDKELRRYLESLPRLDRRIRVTALEENGGISKATNAALAMARGRYIALLDHDDELARGALAAVSRAIEAHPDAEVLYSDEDKIDESGERFDPLFKPEWSPDLLLSFAYLCHLTVIRSDLVTSLGGLRSAFDGSQDYDLSLRATENARHVVHIPEVLYHWRAHAGSAASDTPGAVAKPWAYEAGRRAIEDALSRRDEPAEVESAAGFPGRYHVRRKITGRPRVSVIIPFRDEPALLATCATSLRSDPGYDNFELVLVDNGSELPETEALLDRLSEDKNVRVVRSPGPFNWAAINNTATRSAGGDVLLFMNNDIEARTGRWLEALLGHALRKEVGAVGARLVYPDGAIQHAGVVIGLGGIAGHVLRGLPGDHPGYNSMAIQTRNCSVVTGACMMTRRELFEEVGGFDEALPVAFNDVDYCLKLRDSGYLVVYTPLAELVHHESRSRGHTDDLDESKRILSRWADTIATGDPYMNIHLSHWRYWCPLSTAQEDDRWKNYLETSVLTRGSSSNT